MSAMADMSKAIRTTIEAHGGWTMDALPDAELHDFTVILAAFASDLRAEFDRRGLEFSR